MYDDLDPGPSPMPDIRWNIQRSGRAWTPEEAPGRWQLTPEKFEMDHGKLFWDDTQRLTLLALLLENVGVDQAVRLGDPVSNGLASETVVILSDGRGARQRGRSRRARSVHAHRARV
jgi:hypothetical protein